MILITIKDDDGEIRPRAYLETPERHAIGKQPRLEEGEQFVKVEIKEI